MENIESISNVDTRKISTLGLVLRVFIPTAVLSSLYLLIGLNSSIMPNLLLFCIIATFTMVPIELGIILSASKKEYGKISLKAAFADYEKMKLWKIVLWGLAFFCLAGLASITIQPLENSLMSGLRDNLLSRLPVGFDWTNFDYVRTFSKPVLVFFCIFYGLFNILIGPITEELFFRGYLTSHYAKQTNWTPIIVAVLFSLYHFWLPLNNIFRIILFGCVASWAYRKKNLYICMVFHCTCNLLSVISMCIAVLK